MNDRITFRPGALAKPLERRLRQTGETPSEYLRRIVAEDLGRKTPEMPVGNPQFGPNFGNGKK